MARVLPGFWCVRHNEGVADAPKTLRLAADEVARAAEILRRGGTVAFPTETVYGLGADALSPAAVGKIFAAKQRPHWDPLIVHIASRDQLAGIATSSAAAEALMDAFWPGPLTLLLPRTPAVPDAVTAGRPLVGVRIPAHPLAQALLREAGIAIAAPSANTFGHTSPTTAAHVLADLDGRIDAVLDGGATAVGLESTVAEIQGDEVVVYRPGAVTLAMLSEALDGRTVRLYRPPAQSSVAVEALPSPGVGIRHYAPRARLTLVAVDPMDEERSLLGIANGTARVGVMLPAGWVAPEGSVVYPWGEWDDHGVLAQRLFDGLRALDDAGVERILCPVPEGDGLAAALRDRLEKAAR